MNARNRALSFLARLMREPLAGRIVHLRPRTVIPSSAVASRCQ